jgi:hypothetical protein
MTGGSVNGKLILYSTEEGRAAIRLRARMLSAADAIEAKTAAVSSTSARVR